MDTFARWVIKLRIWVILATVLLTVAGGVAIAKWSYIEADFSKFLPEDDPVVKRFNEAGDRFGGVAVAMVGLEFPDVFTSDAIKRIDTVTRAISKIEGVTWAVSLTDIDDVQSKQVDGERSVAVGPVVDPQAIPEEASALSKLKEYVLGKEGLVGVVVSADSSLANITYGIDRDADRVDVAVAVEKTVRALEPERKLYFGGFPYWMRGMSAIILKDMMVLVPIVTLLVLLILFVSFRTVRGVVLPMVTVIVSSTWAMGLMAALGIPITMLSNVIPVLLIALGTAYAIHLLHKVDEVEGAAPEAYQLNLRRAMVDVMVPIGLAGLTTVIGFLSFLTSNLLFIKQFGLMAAFGIFSAMVVALTLLPAILSFFKPKTKKASKAAGHETGLLSAVLRGLGSLVLRRQRTILIVTLVLGLGAGAFIPLIDRQFNMVEYFPEGSNVREADRMMVDHLGGNTPVWVTVDGAPKHPFVMAQMFTIEKYLMTFTDLANVRSVAGLVAEMNIAAKQTIKPSPPNSPVSVNISMTGLWGLATSSMAWLSL